jgi:hypothetical protein
MEAPGVRLRGLALVVEKDAGPRLALRYDPNPNKDDGGRLFRDLSPKDLAKLFSQTRAKTDQLVEVQLDGLLVVSCPAEVGEIEDDDDNVLWGEVDVERDDAPPTTSRLKRFDVLWAATAASIGDCDNAWTLESLESAARDVRAALRHEERRCGYVSRESALMLAADDTSIEALKRASSLARELAQILDGAQKTGVATTLFNGWVAVRSKLAPMALNSDAEEDSADDSNDEPPEDPASDEDDRAASAGDDDDVDPRLAAARRARRRRRRRRYRPYETLLLLESPQDTLRDLPKNAAPQLRALVAHADPFATFHAVAARAGLPLPRVYRLARHLCEWKRARVIAVVRPDAVYAPDAVPAPVPVEARDGVLASDTAVLAAFGPCKRLSDALDVLETSLTAAKPRDAATERVLALLRRGALRELHTYVLRVDAAPPPGLEAVATAARGKPPRGLAQKRPDHLRLLHVFRALSPCFDGQHSLLEMMWRQDLSQVEVDAALRAFSDLVVTVQR